MIILQGLLSGLIITQGYDTGEPAELITLPGTITFTDRLVGGIGITDRLVGGSTITDSQEH